MCVKVTPNDPRVHPLGLFERRETDSFALNMTSIAIKQFGYLPLLCGALALAPLSGGCSGEDDGSGSTTEMGYNTQLAEKLHACNIISEGKLSDGGADREFVHCKQDCLMQEDDCDALYDIFCDQESEGTQDAYRRYASCVDTCEAAAPKFQCADGYEIPASWKCNAYDDCSGGEDEVGCTSTGGFQCGGDVYPEAFVCDGEINCDDGSDEGPECAKSTCP